MHREICQHFLQSQRPGVRFGLHECVVLFSQPRGSSDSARGRQSFLKSSDRLLLLTLADRVQFSPTRSGSFRRIRQVPHRRIQVQQWPFSDVNQEW